MNPLVDQFIASAQKWQIEMEQLRKIVLTCMLQEELKWKQPCYTFNNSNILIISAFKDYCVISFLKGVLLQDAENLLHSPGKNSQSVKFMKFNSLITILKNVNTIKAYIYEAIEIEKKGLKIAKIDNEQIELVEELKKALNYNNELKTAFNALTAGRRRAYNMFFEKAKQSKTREQQIEKYTTRILMGKGLNDCICGLSKKMPNCDGSHKF